MKALKALWIRFQVIRGFITLVRRPERTDLIIQALRDLQEIADPHLIKTLFDGIFKHSEFKAMSEQRYMPPRPDLNRLRRMPAGTFGKALADHMDKNGINYDVFPEDGIKNDFDYINQRMFLDHDLWHVLLGMSTEVEDELAIQAFNVAQLRTPFAALIISGGLLHLLGKNPLRAADAVGKVAAGFVAGRSAKFLLAVKTHEMFDLPLEEVRAHCRLGGGLGNLRLEREPVALAVH